MERVNLISYLTGISHSVGKGMAGISHAPACCVSKHRSSLEAGKKQLRVCILFVLPLVTFKSSTYPLRISVDRIYSNPHILSANYNKKGEMGQRIQVGSYTLRVKE